MGRSRAFEMGGAGRSKFMSMMGVASTHDRANNRNLYLKADGKRFGDSQTIKIATDAKYDLTITVKPNNPELKLERLVVGGDDMTPDSSKEEGDYTEYLFSWITNGFKPTASGRRNDLRVMFGFPHAEFATSFQVKFYPLTKSSNLTWGTEIKRIELEGRGIGTSPTDGATPLQNLAPTKVIFK